MYLGPCKPVRAGLAAVLARGVLIIGLTAALAACSTAGKRFDTLEMSQIIPGQTTLEEATVLLKGQPENVYRQRDGSAMARWAHTATMVTDAVYFRRELWLQFGADGRFERVVNQVNVQGTVGQGVAAPAAAPQPTTPVSVSTSDTAQPVGPATAIASDTLDGNLPRTVPAAFPYSPDTFRGPTAVYPVR